MSANQKYTDQHKHGQAAATVKYCIEQKFCFHFALKIKQVLTNININKINNANQMYTCVKDSDLLKPCAASTKSQSIIGSATSLCILSKRGNQTVRPKPLKI